MKNGIARSELTTFEGCAHALVYENVARVQRARCPTWKAGTSPALTSMERHRFLRVIVVNCGFRVDN